VTDFLTYFFGGVPQGCVFGLVALGLVLIYKTTGVFNLAFGAQAYLAAAVFYKTTAAEVKGGWGWPTAVSFVVAVLVVSPLVGLFFDRVVFRALQRATWQTKFVSSLGFVIVIPAVVKLTPDAFPGWTRPVLERVPFLLGPQVPFNPPGIVPDGSQFVTSVFGFDISALGVDRNELVTVVSTIVIAVGLGLVFRYGSLGLYMRAVVESPRMVELMGINADRIRSIAWALSSTLAGLAGVLIVPLWSTVDANNFTILVVTAIAAAVFGRLTNLGMALVGGLLLGVMMALFAGYGEGLIRTLVDALVSDPERAESTTQILMQGIRPAIPFLMLAILLIVRPAARTTAGISDPLSGVDPPVIAGGRPVAPTSTRTRVATRAIAVLAVIGFVLWSPSIVFRGQQLLGFTGARWTSLIIGVLATGVVLLAITAFSGLSGQITLAVATFAGFGAYTVANAAERWNLNVTVGIVVGALVATVVGVLLAIPALRLGSIFLALFTLAFALLCSNVVFPLDIVSGGDDPIAAPRPLGFTENTAFFFYALVCFAIAAGIVILVRAGTTGRFLTAVSGSDVAAASIGINATVMRVVVFGLSAFLAGLGGALTATYDNVAIQPFTFDVVVSIVYVVLVMQLAPRTIDGALAGAFGVVIVLALLIEQFAMPLEIGMIVFGLGAVVSTRHPEGLLELIRNRWRRRSQGGERLDADCDGATRQWPRQWPRQSAARAVGLVVVTLGAYAPRLVARWDRQMDLARGRRPRVFAGSVIYLIVRTVGAAWLLAVLMDTNRLSQFRFDGAVLDWIVLVVAAGLWVPLDVTAYRLGRDAEELGREQGRISLVTRWSGVVVATPGLVFVLLTGARTTYFGVFVLMSIGIGLHLAWIAAMQETMNRLGAGRLGAAPEDTCGERVTLGGEVTPSLGADS